MCIQKEMNVPKNLYNSYGGYYYRNAETILDEAKAVCSKYDLVLTVHDEIVTVGDRYYVKAVATLCDVETGETMTNCAFAREDETKKGMDGSQITGSCSSYARKYALNGLFALDDVKDADTNEQARETKNKDKATKQQVDALLKVYKGDNLTKLLKANNIEKIFDLPKAKATELLKAINEKQKGSKANETNK